MKKFLSSLALFAFLMGLIVPYASASVQVSQDGTNKGQFRKLNLRDGVTIDKDGNVDFDSINGTEADYTGDVTFRSTLIATGRTNATLDLASSSTVIPGNNVPYAVIRKNIGAGTGGLDTVDGGTRLPNGKPGAELSIIITSCSGSSYWDLTPVTATGFTAIRFNAKGQNASLLYVDDTIGWTIRAVGTTASAAAPTVTTTTFGSGLNP